MNRILPFLVLMALFYSCNSSKDEDVKTHEYTNDLVNETSPYLLQHAHNPVNWKPWNEKTLEEAKNSGKLMIVSIGYSACHWCHVMERESFEDSLVAAVMNEKFISVKVDREERPDVDQIYINAVQLMTGNAGWPLNVITLPDGRPIWGGTYFQKEEWINSIERVYDLYEEEPQRLEELAGRLAQGVKSVDLIDLNTSKVDFSTYDTKDLVSVWRQNFDTIDGGYKRTQKFMMPNNYSYLLRHGVEEQDEALLAQVGLTLKKMAYGGVYDHIGGGFSRYSVDPKWHVPHFEKMLYDNGQLVSLYSKAFAVSKDPLYKEIVEETLDFIAREMTNSEGAFYSSLDADSETESGELEEGAYYIYTQQELQAELGADYDLFAAYYNINDFGKWEEDHYVLIRTKSDAEILSEHSISEEELQQKKQHWKETLRTYRNERPKPRLDDKTLTSWNGLMLRGYVDAYKAFGNETYKQAAIKNANFIATKQLQQSGALFHSYKDGTSTINGYLEDYAFVIDAFIGLYEITLDEAWIEKAKQMTDYAFEYFFDEEKKMFYFTSSEDRALISRSFQYRDEVIPSSNSAMARNLHILSHHYDERNYAETAIQMLKNVQEEMERYPSAFSNWMDLLANYQDKFYEVVVVGPEANEKIAHLNQTYLPNAMIAGSTTSGQSPLLEGRFVDGETYIYVCVNYACKLPVKEVADAMKLMD